MAVIEERKSKDGTSYRVKIRLKLMNGLILTGVIGGYLLKNTFFNKPIKSYDKNEIARINVPLTAEQHSAH